MSATDWTQRQDGTTLPFHRGFTGHEHYDRFGIINMNARLYDPALARFFSPDPQVQVPFSTQGFNRYSYCGNNPVMRTDPDGKWFVLDVWIKGFLYGLLNPGDNNNCFESAWNTANRYASNDLKIWGGLFVTDPNKSFGNRILELVSRFTWQLPQTGVGLYYSLLLNHPNPKTGEIRNVEYLYGAAVISHTKDGWGAVTLGSFINGDKDLEASPYNSLFQHEYGHYIQSQKYGIFYLSRYGIPSGLNCIDWLRGDKKHYDHPAEQDANIRALEYFNKHIDGYTDWDFEQNPIHSGLVLYSFFSLLIWISFVHCGQVFSAAEYHIRCVRCQDTQRGKNSTEII